MSYKKALILYNGNITSAPRPTRVIQYLSLRGFEISIVSSINDSLPSLIKKNYPILDYSKKSGFSRIRGAVISRLMPITTFLRINWLIGDWLWEKFYGISNYKSLLRNERFDIILAEDITFIPFSLSIYKENSKVILDAREYYVEEFDNSSYFKYFVAPEKRRLCKKYLKKIYKIYTVSQGIADAYAFNFGVFPSVIRSAPFFVDLMPKLKSSGPIRMVHHGVANKDRKIERMIDVVKQLNGRFTLDFYINGNYKYIQYLKKYAEGYSNINFNETVSFSKIISMLSSYDLGFYMLIPTNFNNENSLPNKFFEFIQARLAIAIGPSPEMSRIGSQYGFALVSDDFSVDSMLTLLNKLTWEDVNKMKLSANLAASDLCWETESLKLEKVFF